MVAKISGGSGGSCQGLADYLEKEVKGQWFSLNHSQQNAPEVVASIDANKKNLGKQEEKYYQLILSPSQKELSHIGNDRAKLEAYTRGVMEQYAHNFGKGIESRDLVWFAKIEQSRSYSQQDRVVQTGEVNRGKAKEGPQTHVHIIVSRTEKLARYQERKQAGEIDRKNPLKLSPATHHRDTSKGAVKGGFDRTSFKQAAEQQFDTQFSYPRLITETFAYANTLDKGNQAERIAMRQAAEHELRTLAEQQKQQQAKQHEPIQSPAESKSLQPTIKRDESLSHRMRGPSL